MSEVLISDAFVASGYDAAGLTARRLDLKGIDPTVTAWSSTGPPKA